MRSVSFDKLKSQKGLVKKIHIMLVKPRNTDTRAIDPNHVLEIAKSISAIGLVQNIAIDCQNRLVCGDHRFKAMMLLHLEERERIKYWDKLIENSKKAIKGKSDPLNELKALDSDNFKERYPRRLIPVVQFDFDSLEDSEAAFALEVTENEKRKEYTAKEIRELAERFKSLGYENRKGRPNGEMTLSKLLELITGKSRMTLYRYLNNNNVSTDTLFNERKELGKIRRISDKFLKCSENPRAKREFENILKKLDEVENLLEEVA